MISTLGLLALLGVLFGAIVVLVLAAALPVVGRHQVKTSLRHLSLYDTNIISRSDIAEINLSQRMRLALSRLAGVGRRLSPGALLHHLDSELVYAGISRGLDKVLAAKALGLLAGIAVGLLVSVFIGSLLLRVALIVLLAAVGFFIPDIWLTLKANARQKAIRLSLPGVLDLLAVSVEAGLGFDSALARVIKNMEGPLPEEFARMLREIQMGSSRKAAFRSLSDRTTVAELRSFLSAMIQADIFGVSIAETLRVEAHEMRVRRRQKAEEIAQKAPVKLVFPMILCIFPALFVVLLGPAAIRIYSTIISTVQLGR